MFIGRYEVLGELGAGGMGRVRLAKSPGGQVVVIKSCLNEQNKDDEERLRDEARVGLRLSHPGIVETLDLFEHEGRPHLVIAYVSGASMLDLRRHRPLAPSVVCRVGRQIAEALDAVHHAVDERGRPLHMLHRDVTPGNIMLGHDGNARLIDLGIARSDESRAQRTSTGCLRGTLRYLAPELFDNAPHSPRSDMWALGVVLWEALLGRPAIKGSDAECVGKILSGRVMLKDATERVDPRVERAVGSLLAKNPDDRPRRARDAAAIFAMLEKELGMSEALARDAVVACVGPPRFLPDDGEAMATKNLVENAAATFCAPELQLLPTGFVDVSPSDLVELSDPVAATGAVSLRSVTGTIATEQVVRGAGEARGGFADLSTVVEASDVVEVAAVAPPMLAAPPMVAPPHAAQPMLAQPMLAQPMLAQPRATSPVAGAPAAASAGSQTARTLDARPPQRRNPADGFMTEGLTTPADKLKAYAAMLQHLERSPREAIVLDDVVDAVVGVPLPPHPLPTEPPTTGERRLAAEHKRAGQRSVVVLVALAAIVAIGCAATWWSSGWLSPGADEPAGAAAPARPAPQAALARE